MCTLCVRKMIQAIHDSPETPAADIVKSFDGHSMEKKCPAMLALESLTALGSEFWEDPKRCFTHAESRYENIWDLARNKIKQLNAAAVLFRDLTDAYLELYQGCCCQPATLLNLGYNLGGLEYWDDEARRENAIWSNNRQMIDDIVADAKEMEAEEDAAATITYPDERSDL